jgi:DNA-binding NtrC family response regulator
MTILLVEDKASLREMLATTLKLEGFHVIEAKNLQEAKQQLVSNTVSALITDLKLPDGSGIDLIRFEKNLGLDMPIIMMTAYATIEGAVTAMKLGAYEFLTKPVDPELLIIKLKSAMTSHTIQLENKNLKKRLRDDLDPIGISPLWLNVIEKACKIAESEANILITGESGTGKEILARYIHKRSKRSEGPYIIINCAAIPQELLESELFGSERGAYTGSIKRKQGHFELADGGSIMLDEIGDLEFSLQAKVLRVIQERSFVRVGGENLIHVDVRIIAASNKDLLEAIKHDRFREDLYYRLNVLPIHIPPLRQRIEDIPLLAEHFLKVACEKLGKPTIRLSPQIMKTLQSYLWPGNVRQLENHMERVAIMGHEILTDNDLTFLTDSGSLDYLSLLEKKTPLADIAHSATFRAEREYILAALRITGGNKAKAAVLLSISYKTLFNKLKEFGITEEERD